MLKKSKKLLAENQNMYNVNLQMQKQEKLNRPYRSVESSVYFVEVFVYLYFCICVFELWCKNFAVQVNKLRGSICVFELWCKKLGGQALWKYLCICICVFELWCEKFAV